MHGCGFCGRTCGRSRHLMVRATLSWSIIEGRREIGPTASTPKQIGRIEVYERCGEAGGVASGYAITMGNSCPFFAAFRAPTRWHTLLATDRKLVRVSRVPAARGAPNPPKAIGVRV
jgi:hypothetical protein